MRYFTQDEAAQVIGLAHENMTPELFQPIVVAVGDAEVADIARLDERVSREAAADALAESHWRTAVSEVSGRISAILTEAKTLQAHVRSRLERRTKARAAAESAYPPVPRYVSADWCNVPAIAAFIFALMSIVATVAGSAVAFLSLLSVSGFPDEASSVWERLPFVTAVALASLFAFSSWFSSSSFRIQSSLKAYFGLGSVVALAVAAAFFANEISKARDGGENPLFFVCAALVLEWVAVANAKAMLSSSLQSFVTFAYEDHPRLTIEKEGEGKLLGSLATLDMVISRCEVTLAEVVARRLAFAAEIRARADSMRAKHLAWVAMPTHHQPQQLQDERAMSDENRNGYHRQPR